MTTTGTQRRQAIIDQVASCVCKDRQNTYGDAESNFENIAEYWTVWLRSRKLIAAHERIAPHDVAVMSGLIKVARLSTSPDHIDNWVDLAGYSVCGGGIRVAQKQTPEARKDEAIPEVKARSKWERKSDGLVAFVDGINSGYVIYRHTDSGAQHDLLLQSFVKAYKPCTD